MADEKRLERIEDKLDKVAQDIAEINVVLGKQSVVLVDHTSRSLSNEKAVSILRDELKPVLAHVAVMNFLSKMALAVLGSGLVWELFKWITSQ